MNLDQRSALPGFAGRGNDIGEVVLRIEDALLSRAGNCQDRDDPPLEAVASAMIAFIVDTLATQVTIDVARRQDMLRLLASGIAERAEHMSDHSLDRRQIPAGIAATSE